MVEVSPAQLPAAVPMNRSSSSGSSSAASLNPHTLWSDYMNAERNTLVQDYPQLDRKVLGGFISNVLNRISQSQEKSQDSNPRDPDDEWHAALLGEISALRDYYPSGFRVFADFASRIIRRAANNGQASSSPYRPPPSTPTSRRGSSAFSDPRSGSPPASWSLPPISSLPQGGPDSSDISRHYSHPPLSPPKSTSPKSNPEEYHHHHATSSGPAASSGGYYGRSGTDPHLFSLDSFVARPVPTRPGGVPQKRPAEEYPPAHQRPFQREEERSVAAMLSEANAISAKLGNMAVNNERSPQVATKNGEGRSLACLRCRRKKTRCNHARPTCSRCAHSGFKCEYPDPLPKPTDMASSIAKLQEKLNILNSKIQSGERLME